MDIILKQKEDRDHKIQQIEKILRENKEIDEKELRIDICNGLRCSFRTAGEYLKIAKWRIKDEPK